ncbi:hypothetical protein HYPSUDRAFT_210281 [Hypholoma sublateritium FD-334 SS-4]|uniref:Uncharacterized protein n=1 Tax=Hypholoma sublateritium (strain FD-334 SS-4) TaxID=945553 RepID=A0A0D2KDM7_HYPSF|nr:hypothetical protein HYPSUDRAFT_210281 [Hypholoma sublateritium FD-334 SS-4]
MLASALNDGESRAEESGQAILSIVTSDDRGGDCDGAGVREGGDTDGGGDGMGCRTSGDVSKSEWRAGGGATGWGRRAGESGDDLRKSVNITAWCDADALRNDLPPPATVHHLSIATSPLPTATRPTPPPRSSQCHPSAIPGYTRQEYDAHSTTIPPHWMP